MDIAQIPEFANLCAMLDRCPDPSTPVQLRMLRPFVEAAFHAVDRHELDFAAIFIAITGEKPPPPLTEGGPPWMIGAANLMRALAFFENNPRWKKLSDLFARVLALPPQPRIGGEVEPLRDPDIADHDQNWRTKAGLSSGPPPKAGIRQSVFRGVAANRDRAFFAFRGPA